MRGREGKSWPSCGMCVAEGGFLWHMPWGSSVQSAAAVDPAANFHWSSQERVVAVAQHEEPNSYWLLSVWLAGSREAWQRAALQLDEAIPR